MFRQFKFEEPFYPKLDQIPASTQFKLEAMGFNLPLSLWNRLALAERLVLCHLPIRSRGEKECYSHYLAFLFKREGFASSRPEPTASDTEKKAWEEIGRVPSDVAKKMRDLNLPLFWPEWIKLDDIERYALFKFCRENTEDAQIQQVVQEFLGTSNVPSPAI